MGTDRLGTPCPPDVLLSAYAVEPDPGRGPGTTDARHVAGLTVLDGYLCAAVGGAGGVPGELLVVDHAGVQGTAAQGGAVQGGAVQCRAVQYQALGFGVLGCRLRPTAFRCEGRRWH